MHALNALKSSETARRWVSILFLTAINFGVYFASLSTGFFADDYEFLEPLARLDTPQYLAFYLDPRAQVLWYRPLHRGQMLIEWWLFGANAVGYHIVQILIHIVNGLLLWAIVARVSKNSRLGFFAALLYATFPVYALAINWINITDPAMTVFYLAGIWFWLNYLGKSATRPRRAGLAPAPTKTMARVRATLAVALSSGVRRDYVLALMMFALALLYKQMALTLPAILFLLDVLIVNSEDVIVSQAIAPHSAGKQSPDSGVGIAWGQESPLATTLVRWLRRYFAFGIVALAFLGLQRAAGSTGTFASVFGYTVGPHILLILAQYLALLVFPWGYYPPSDTQIVDQIPDFIPMWTVAWMVVAIVAYLWLLAKTRSRALLFLGMGCFITLLPVLPFPFIELRYLYLPAMFAAIALAIWFERAREILSRTVGQAQALPLQMPRPFALFAPLALVLLIVGNALVVANANAGIFEIARQRRVPFRDISRAHATFPDDTLLYFIDPVSPLSELSGMFTLRYGRGVNVSGDARGIAALRAHNAAFLYYFDETAKPIEIAIDQGDTARAALALPADLNARIRLDGYEIARARVRRGEMFVLLLYWRATGNIAVDYTVFVHLTDQHGKSVFGYDSQPHKGESPTSKWKLHAVNVDPILFVIPSDVPPGEYRLNVGMYDLQTQERLLFVDAQGQPMADQVVIEGVQVQ